jgi:GTP cyclohydrolase IA
MGFRWRSTRADFSPSLLAGGLVAVWSMATASEATGHERKYCWSSAMRNDQFKQQSRLTHDVSNRRISVLKTAYARALRSEETVATMKASDRIRRRLTEVGQDFRANDNIADFIEDGELDELRLEVEARMLEVLRALVIDTANDHNTADTARRVAKMFISEVFSGRYRAAPSVTAFPNMSQLNELMIVGPIKVRSACSHHLCPIMGRVWIGILPSTVSDLIGLSKYARLCDWIMSRPQIQEEAVVMLADELERRIKPDGLAVVMEADHFCMHWRGVKDDESVMSNSVMRGAFLKDAALRREFLSLRSQGKD